MFKRTRIVVNKKTGKKYTYTFWQHNVRKGKKVKSFQFKVPPSNRGWAYIERQMEKYPGDPHAAKSASLQAGKDKLSKELGVDLSPNAGPVEKAPADTAPASEKGKKE